MTGPGTYLDSLEQRSLFNAAFLAVLAHASAEGFFDRSGKPMPLPYFYVSLPLALHQETRAALPRTTAGSMWGWVRENPRPLSDLASRVVAMRPLVSRALAFGIAHSALLAEGDGLAPGSLRRRPKTLRPTADWNACRKAAGFVGRWLAGQRTDTASTLALWGLRP
jgi:hypothetical protein